MKWTEARRLQFAAFLVAASRYTALGGMLIGLDLMRLHWVFQAFEVASWFFFAVLEGFAIPYISRGMEHTTAGTYQRRTLLAYRVILLLSLPALGAPLYAAIATKQQIIDLLGWLYWGWAFLAAGLVAVIADAVGIVEGVLPAETPKSGELRGIINALREAGPVDPGTLAKLSGADPATCDAVITTLRNGKV